MSRFRDPRPTRERGQGLAEFALVFPIMIVLLIAVFDGGRLVFAYNDITNASRNGVRQAIVNQGGAFARDATIASATSLGLQPSDVTITYLTDDLTAACPSPYKIGCVARVQVRYQWQAITPVIGSIIGPMTLTTQTTMPLERIYP